MKEKSIVSEGRRKFLKRIIALPLISSITNTSSPSGSNNHAYLTEDSKASLNRLEGILPKGKLGKHEISRLVLGCNPMCRSLHARDLSYVADLSSHWFTDNKMKETWALAEQAGINTCNLVAAQYKVFNEYKKETGSKMLNICQAAIGNPSDRLVHVKKAIDDGADFIFIQGNYVDDLAQSQSMDVVFNSVRYIQDQGMLAGVGAHSLKSIEASIKEGVKPDFYYKTFHHDKYWSATPRENRTEYPKYSLSPITDHNQWNDNMWDQFSEQTIEAFKSINVPFFGFKVLAAGAIRPQDGIRWAYEQGADFVCLGMYDFQLIDDVNLTIKILSNLGKRDRPWMS